MIYLCTDRYIISFLSTAVVRGRAGSHNSDPTQESCVTKRTAVPFLEQTTYEFGVCPQNETAARKG